MGTLPAYLQGSSSARCTGGFPCRTVLQHHRSLSALHSPALTHMGRLRQGTGHEAAKRAELLPLLSPLPPDSLYSPPRSPPLLGISQLPVYKEEQETVDFIQAFVSSPEKVNRGHFEHSCAGVG